MTLTVTMESAFLALTTTPSIAPSASEVTCPFRATGACAHAQAAESMNARPAAKPWNRSLVRISSLRSVRWMLHRHSLKHAGHDATAPWAVSPVVPDARVPQLCGGWVADFASLGAGVGTPDAPGRRPDRPSRRPVRPPAQCRGGVARLAHHPGMVEGGELARLAQDAA